MERSAFSFGFFSGNLKFVASPTISYMFLSGDLFGFWIFPAFFLRRSNSIILDCLQLQRIRIFQQYLQKFFGDQQVLRLCSCGFYQLGLQLFDVGFGDNSPVSFVAVSDLSYGGTGSCIYVGCNTLDPTCVNLQHLVPRWGDFNSVTDF